MKKQDLTRFVGLPYKFLGTDFTGVDCIGLCQLFFNEHGYPIEIRDGRPIKKDWYLTEPYRLARWLVKHFNKIEKMEDMQYGDIVLFEINGESHTSIYIDNGKVLTILEVFKSKGIKLLKDDLVSISSVSCVNVVIFNK